MALHFVLLLRAGMQQTAAWELCADPTAAPQLQQDSTRTLLPTNHQIPGIFAHRGLFLQFLGYTYRLYCKTYLKISSFSTGASATATTVHLQNQK